MLVAHRGDAKRYPENTLAAFASAARLGIRHVELDVQVTADGVPLIMHDGTLTRTHGLDVAVTSATLADLARLGVVAGGDRRPPVPLLAEFAAWLRGEPAVHAFVELKTESLRARGRRPVLARIAEILLPLRSRVTLISYDARVLAMAKRADFAIGYVLPGLGARYRTTAERLAPGLLLAEWRQIRRAERLWPGTWRWAAFEIANAETARQMLALGVHYLETMDPAALLGAGITGIR